MNNGNVNNNNKTNTNRVRAVAPVPVVSVSAATSSAVYDIPFSSIVEAWIDCERNKRSSNSCIRFRWHAARDLKKLWLDMRSGTYKPGKSMVFMATHPVMREIWAGVFSDRVVHHWEALRYGGPLEQYFEEYAGNVSMNCRKGFGSLRAVVTFYDSIRKFTENFTRDDCWIVGGDFKQFFPSIRKPIAYSLMEDLMTFMYKGPDMAALLHFLSITIHHRPQENYFNISDESLWDNYPKSKSLFHSDGFAPGNLISQHVANLIGAVFSVWMIHTMKAAGFIIFVDDWRCLVRSPEEGRALLRKASVFLRDELGITLHPDKIYLQHYSKGTKFVGSFIKPPGNSHSQLSLIKEMSKWVKQGFAGNLNVRKYAKFLLDSLKHPPVLKIPFRYEPEPKRNNECRIYISNRTRGHFIDAMRKYNAMPQAQTHAGRVALLEKLRASINSYLGMMAHYKSYRVRRKIAEKYILPVWHEYLYFTDDFAVCIIKMKYDRRHLLKRRLRRHNFAAAFIRPKY